MLSCGRGRHWCQPLTYGVDPYALKPTRERRRRRHRSRLDCSVCAATLSAPRERKTPCQLLSDGHRGPVIGSMTGDGSWSVSFAVSPSQTTAAMSGGSSRADTKQALRQGRMWSDQVKRSPGFSPIFELDGQSASPLIASRPTKHSWSATKLQATRTEHTHLPWASLSLSLPSLHKQKPAAQQHAHTPNISFQASPAHVLPACSDHVASSPSVTPPNKRRCIPWHQAEFSMPIKPQKQPMLASITASSDLRRSKRRQPSLLSTQHTAMQSRASDSCISRRHQHSPILCLASAASRAVDEEAEEVLLTRTKDLSLRVKDRLKTLSKRMPNQMRRLVAGAVAGLLHWQCIISVLHV